MEYQPIIFVITVCITHYKVSNCYIYIVMNTLNSQSLGEDADQNQHVPLHSKKGYYSCIMRIVSKIKSLLYIYLLGQFAHLQ